MKLPKPTEIELCPAGNHVARCYLLVDMGTQEDNFGPKHVIRIGWELCHETMENGKPLVVGAEFTFSMADRANLRKMFISWRGRDFTEQEFETFDMKSILGVPAMVNIVHTTSAKGKTYDKVDAVTKVPAGVDVPELVNEKMYFSFQEPDAAEFDRLYDWIKNRIAQSPEYRALTNEGEAPEDQPVEQPFAPVGVPPEDEVPF